MPNVRKDPPTIAVEFVSAGKRDRQRDYVIKRKEYLAAGLAEYWIIDRFRRVLTVFRSQQGSVEELVIREGDVYRSSPLLPGFELPLASLLAVSDALENAQGSEPAPE